MAIVIGLEQDSGTPSPSPESSKKRSYGETAVEDGTISSPVIGTSGGWRQDGGHDESARKAPVGVGEVGNDAVENAAEDQSLDSDLVENHVAEDESHQTPQDKTIKELLLNALDNIDDHSAGSFAAFGTLSSAANPGLYVEGLGPIGLPLTASDAHRLVAICHQAPFGRGSETIVDTSVRRTWELNPSQFLLRNPAWSKTIKKFLIKTATDLGI
ncbi:hypothetical protein MMC15_004745 [Xylographa vitiligo]|nr:hypothetical protein [Xylographa vitiligo]